jgi:hypothetical protein
MHQLLVVHEIAVMPGPDRLPSGGACNRVHPSPCHRAAQRYDVLPWWFQPRATQIGPATHEDASINPPTAAEGPGNVFVPVVVASAEPDSGVRDTAMKLATAIAIVKITEGRCRFTRSLYRRRSKRLGARNTKVTNRFRRKSHTRVERFYGGTETNQPWGTV